MGKIQLYSLASPNGIKISVALEEVELPYDAHSVDILKGEQHSKAFLTINPHGKIPAMTDPDGPDGKPVTLAESNAILLYLAEKTGKLISIDAAEKLTTIQWLFFQASAVGPMFGAFGHFHTYGRKNCDHPYPEERFARETQKLLDIMEQRLSRQTYIVHNDYSIADIATFPWVIWLDMFYKAAEQLELAKYKHINRWVQQCRNRPLTIKGLDRYGFNDITQ